MGLKTQHLSNFEAEILRQNPNTTKFIGANYFTHLQVMKK